jgi:hypothetical protein
MILFVQKNYFIKDITNFSQYIRNFSYQELDPKLKLITIIGELHGVSVECTNNPSGIKVLDIVEYITQVSKNINKKVILEYDKYSQPEGISYGNINKIDNEIKDNPKIIKTAIDFRRQFLGVENQQILYESSDLYKSSKEDILKLYIDPFFIHIGEYTKYITGEENYDDLVQILFDDYLPKVGDNFQKIAIFIRDKWDKINDETKISTIQKLKVLWAQIGDYYILREIFKDEDVDEYIILIGQGHYYNITKYFDDVLCKDFNKRDRNKLNFQKITSINATKNSDGKINCIDIKNTGYAVEDSQKELYKNQSKPIFQLYKLEDI